MTSNHITVGFYLALAYGGGPPYTKSGIVMLSTRWQSNIHYILQDLVHYSLAAPDVHTRECRLDGSLYGHLEVAADRLNTILEALTDHLMLHHLHEEPMRDFFWAVWKKTRHLDSCDISFFLIFLFNSLIWAFLVIVWIWVKDYTYHQLSPSPTTLMVLVWGIVPRKVRYRLLSWSSTGGVIRDIWPR